MPGCGHVTSLVRVLTAGAAGLGGGSCNFEVQGVVLVHINGNTSNSLQKDFISTWADN